MEPNITGNDADDHASPEDTSNVKGLWSGPPSPPNPDVVVDDLSCQGTVGLALHTALHLVAQSDSHITQPNDGTESSVTALPLTAQAIDRITESFGRAVAQSQYEQWTSEAEKASTDRYAEASSHVRDCEAAPAALLRGRIDHYNRIGSKWRFVIADAELVPRATLDRNRRKRNRPSFWNVAQQRQSTTPPIKIKRLEVLVYNDVE